MAIPVQTLKKEAGNIAGACPRKIGRDPWTCKSRKDNAKLVSQYPKVFALFTCMADRGTECDCKGPNDDDGKPMCIAVKPEARAEIEPKNAEPGKKPETR